MGHPARLEAGVPEVGALAGHAEGAGNLGLGAALGEQFGRLEPSDLKGGTLFGRVGAAGGRHRRTLTHDQPSRQPNPRNSNSLGVHEGCWRSGLDCESAVLTREDAAVRRLYPWSGGTCGWWLPTRYRAAKATLKCSGPEDAAGHTTRQAQPDRTQAPPQALRVRRHSWGARLHGSAT